MKANLNAYLRLSLGMGLCGFAMLLPFDYGYLPDIGSSLSRITEPILQALGQLLFTDCQSCLWALVSDSHGFYLLAAICLILALMAGLVLHRWVPAKLRRLTAFFESVALLYLIMQLGRYGLVKITGQQFETPGANILYTPLGMLDKDILLWSTLGLSPTYTLVTGLLELGTAALLISRKTRFLGLALSILMLGHIILMDYAFGIEVKGFACLLLGIALYLIAPSLRLSIGNENGLFIPSMPSFSNQLALSPLIRTTCLLLLAIDIYGTAVPPPQNIPLDATAPWAFEIRAGGSASYKRVFTHASGYLILQNEDYKSSVFPILFISPEHIVLRHSQEELKLRQIAEGQYRLEGELEGSRIQWPIHALEVKALPAMQPSGTWIKQRPA